MLGELTMENIIEINNLYKSYNDVHAVNNLSFRVKKGELFIKSSGSMIKRLKRTVNQINILCSESENCLCQQ